MIDQIRPQRITWLDSTLAGDIKVSSVHYHIFTLPRDTDETCVFFVRDNRSEVVGKYDDHEKVVRLLERTYEATVVSK